MLNCEQRCNIRLPRCSLTGWWMNANSVQMGAFTVVGYLLYRFSQSQSHSNTCTYKQLCCLVFYLKSQPEFSNQRSRFGNSSESM